MQAQSTQTPPANPAPAQQDNPFPGETTPAKGQSPSQTPSQSTGQKPGSTKPQPKSSSDNPFPGEDSGAPILPVDPGPGADSGSAGRSPRPGTDSAGTGRRDADPDGDPVRSPDSPVHRDTDDGFSSSRAGMKDVPAEDENGAKPGKSTRAKTREEQVKEDLDVGGFYMDRKNWKAAQARFTSAFALDSENPDAVYDLAEVERHLQLFKEAAGHYKLFLSYDPDGPHSKAARKALDEVESARPAADAKAGNAEGLQPK